MNPLTSLHDSVFFQHANNACTDFLRRDTGGVHDSVSGSSVERLSFGEYIPDFLEKRLARCERRPLCFSLYSFDDHRRGRCEPYEESVASQTVYIGLPEYDSTARIDNQTIDGREFLYHGCLEVAKMGPAEGGDDFGYSTTCHAHNLLVERYERPAETNGKEPSYRAFPCASVAYENDVHSRCSCATRLILSRGALCPVHNSNWKAA
jgi:hypothetical protein